MQKAISAAKTLGEVERLQAMLAVNQVPGLTTNGSTNGKLCMLTVPHYHCSSSVLSLCMIVLITPNILSFCSSSAAVYITSF